MAKLAIQVASTSQTVNVFVQDSSSTTGAGLTGLAFNTASLTAYYALPKAAAVSITLATLAAVTTAYSSGGFKEIDATNMPGWYRFDIPDAAIASGRFVSIHFKGATNMAPLPLEIELTGWNNQDAVHGGFTCLPNTACTTNASLLTSGTGTDQLSVTSGRIDVGKALGTAVTLDSNNVLNVSTKYLAGTSQTGRDIGASVLLSSGTGTGQVSLSSGLVTLAAVTHTGARIPNVTLTDTVTTYTGNTVQTGDNYARLGAPAGASHAADVAAVKVDTAAVKLQTDKLAFTVTNQVDSNVLDWKSATAPAMTGDAYARLGAPAGASVSADLAAVPTANANADALLDRTAGVETSWTLRQALRIMLASVAGKLSGGSTTTVAIRDVGDSKDRITATVDASGNRSAVSYDKT